VSRRTSIKVLFLTCYIFWWVFFYGYLHQRSFASKLNIGLDKLLLEIVAAPRSSEWVVGFCSTFGIRWVELYHLHILHSQSWDCIQGLLKKSEKKLAQSFNFTYRYIDDVLSLNNSRFGDFVDRLEYRINWEIYTPYAGAAGMLLHMNGQFTMGKLKSSLLSFLESVETDERNVTKVKVQRCVTSCLFTVSSYCRQYINANLIAWTIKRQLLWIGRQGGNTYYTFTYKIILLTGISFITRCMVHNNSS
jgi:hypothetical protein